MASNISIAATLRVKHRKATTKEARLAALTLADEEERKALAEPYLRAVPDGHYLQPKAQQHLSNPYLQFFHSEEGDAETAESLLPPVPDARQSGAGRRQGPAKHQATWRNKHRAEEKVRVSVDEQQRAVSPSSFNGHLLDDETAEELPYSHHQHHHPPGGTSLLTSSNTSRHRAPTLLPSSSTPNLSSGGSGPKEPSSAPSAKRETPPASGAVPSSSSYVDRARLRAYRPRHGDDQVDLLALNSATAQAYVKYEKLYRMMVSEDDEFFAFRRQYFKKLDGKRK